MLEIQQVKRYTIARYPQKQFVESRNLLARSLAARGATSVVLLALLEACDGTGTTGPPPVVPDLVTENEARQIIEQTFNEEGISFANDVPLVLRLSAADSIEFDLDGFNDSLQVGYEYLFDDDYAQFYPAFGALDSLMNAGGPYIKPVGTVHEGMDYVRYLRGTVREFIDTLKANGVI
jgi:hypothetical protein